MLLAAWACNNKFWVIHQAYHAPLRDIFKEVINFDPQEQMDRYGKKVMNQKFIEILKKEKPDYIMLFLIWDEFYPETLVRIKEILPNVKVVQWNGDDDIKFDNYTIPYSAIIDYQFISQLQFTKKYDEYLLPWFDMLGADIEKFRPLRLNKRYDVAFVGTPKGERLEYVRYLLQKGVKFVLGGGGWKDYPEFKDKYIGQVPDEEFIKLINETKINICFSKNYFSVPHVLERSLQVNACKAFALTGYAPGYFHKFTEKKDIVTFKNKEELLEKINYYLVHEKEREKIAESAYKKITKLYSNQKMLRDAFNAIERDKKEMHSISSLKYMNDKPVYLERDDFNKGIKYIKNKVAKFKYVCFKNDGHENLPLRDYFQTYSMELLKKPISICNTYLNSKIIGVYAMLDLFYAYKYLADKKYFYENADISQFMVKKKFFIENAEKFASLYEGKKCMFIKEDNTSFISMPLVKTRKIKKLPLKNVGHILFLNFDSDNLVFLWYQKKLIKSSYLYRLIFYSIFVNPQMLKYLLLYTARRTKNPYCIKISNFFDKIF